MTTPQRMMKALDSGDLEAVRTILAAEPELAAGRDPDGIPLLLRALYRRHIEVAEALAEQRDEIDLIEAAALGRTRAVGEHLRAEPSAHEQRSPDGFTALHYAAYFAHPEVVAELLAAGADPNAVAENPSRVRPVHSAVARRDIDSCRLLLEAGADPDARQAGGYTALHSASKVGDRKLVGLLLANDAEARLAADDGHTAETFAGEAGHGELAEQLRGDGEEAVSKASDRAAGSSRRDLLLATAPISIAALFGARAAAGDDGAEPLDPRQPSDLVRETVLKAHFDIDRVRELVEGQPELAKASVDWGFGDWESAIGAASHTGRREIAELLLSHGARPTLFTHAMLGHLGVVQATVEASPGIQATPGPHGITLLEHARAGGEAAQAVVAYLETVGGADPTSLAEPLPLPLAAYVGRYQLDGSRRVFDIVEHRDALGIESDGHPTRQLVHVGGGVLHPLGAPSVRVSFRDEGGSIVAVTIEQASGDLSARRIAADSELPEVP